MSVLLLGASASVLVRSRLGLVLYLVSIGCFFGPMSGCAMLQKRQWSTSGFAANLCVVVLAYIYAWLSRRWFAS